LAFLPVGRTFFRERPKRRDLHNVCRVEEMAVYAVLSKLTDEGRKTLKAKPERVKEVNEEISSMGARVLHQFALLGEYDFLTILEAENDVAISKVMVDLGSRGTLETSTLPAIPIDDFLARFKA
jgi:uncharacterized protein with GYD domain